MTGRATKPTAKGPHEAALGAAFKEARAKAGLTLQSTADSLGTAVNTIRWHEEGASIMTPDRIMRAAKLFNGDPVAMGVTYHFTSALAELMVAAQEHGFTVVNRDDRPGVVLI